MTKALHDIASARVLTERDEPYFDTAIFHCQQAAEKSLKGFLIYHDIEFEKTHDIVSIIDLAVPVESGFEKWRIVGETLNLYAVAPRYPDEEPDPTSEDFQSALGTATELYDFVLSRLPITTHPAE